MKTYEHFWETTWLAVLYHFKRSDIFGIFAEMFRPYGVQNGLCGNNQDMIKRHFCYVQKNYFAFSLLEGSQLRLSLCIVIFSNIP